MKSPLIRCLVLVLIVLFFALLVVLSSPDRWRHSSDGSSLSSETSDRAWKWLQSKNSSAATGAISKRVPRIFCIVLTAPKNFHKLTAILSIWVSKCTNYRLISMFKANETIKSNSTRKFIGEPINLLQPPGLQRENYSELTDKVYNAVRDVYLEFGEQYDWYLKADDDTYLNYENLLTFVEDKDPMAKYVYGSFSFIYYPYAVGGPGYLLGTKSFGMLGRALKNKEFCPNSGVEDWDVGGCLLKLSIMPGNSTDSEDRLIFFSFQFDWASISKNKDRDQIFFKNKDCCSDLFVSFHHMELKQMYRLEAVTNRLNKINQLAGRPKPTFKEIRLAYRKMRELEGFLTNTTNTTS